MGSCLSKKEREKWKKAPSSSSHSCCRDPPPPDSPHEEEKVKEVLSETPNPNLNKVTMSGGARASRDINEIHNNNNNVDEKEKDKEIEEKKKKKKDDDFQDRSEDTSEVFSETFSVSTPVPETEKKKKTRSDKVVEEEEEHHHQQLKRRMDRSPARYQRKRSVSGELHPPAKKVSGEDQRGGGVGIGCRSGRSSSPNSVVGRTHSARETAVARNNRVVSAACEKFRRDHGEISEEKRSASQRAIVGGGGGQCRSLSASRAANGRCSPQRIQAAVQPAEVPGNGGGDSVKESLENPHVSLECFIFL